MRRNLRAGAALATVLTLITPVGAADPPDTVTPMLGAIGSTTG